MTRVTAPREIARLTRTLSTTAAAPRPSRLANNLTRTAASRVRRELEQQDASASERTMTTSHRPVVPTPNPNRIIPLMQGFHTTHQARLPQTQTQTQAMSDPAPYTMDFAVMPGATDLFPAGTAAPWPTSPLSSSSSSSSTSPATTVDHVRVPLLPDNFAPARSPTVGHNPEVPDAPLAAPEIVVLAADPSRVDAVSPLSEVEGMGPDGVELMFVHDRAGAGRSGAAAAARGGDMFAGGMLRGL